MAYALRHTIELQSHAGLLYQVLILQEGFAGTNTDLTAFGSDGFELSYNGEADELWEPVKASDLRITMTGTDAQMQSLVGAITTAATNDFIVKVNRSSDAGTNYSFIWGGVVTHEVVEIPDRGQYIVEITAFDGLADLDVFDNLYFDDIKADFTLQPYCHPSELMDWCLKKLPYYSEFWGTGTSQVKWVENWQATNETGSRWQDSVFINLLAFGEWQENIGDWLMKSPFQMIQEILNSWGSQIFLSEGKFVIRSIGYMTTSTRAVKLFEDGVFSALTSEAADIEILQTANNARTSGGKFMYKQPVKVVRKKIQYKNATAGEIGNIWENFTEYETYQTGGTSYTTGFVDLLTLNSNDVFYLDFAYFLIIRGQVSGAYTPYVPSEVLWRMSFKVTNGGVVRYLSGIPSTQDFTWQTTAASVVLRSAPFVLTAPDALSGGVPEFSTYINNSFRVQLPFISGLTEIEIKIEPFQTQFIDGAAWVPAFVEIDFSQSQLSIIPLNDEAGQITGLASYAATSGYSNSLVVDLPDGVFHDAPTETNSGCIYTSSGNTATEKWYDVAVGSGVQYFLPEFVCMTVLRYMQRPLRLYSGRFINSLINFQSRLIVAYDSTNLFFVWNGGKFCAKRDEWTGELWAANSTAGVGELGTLTRRPSQFGLQAQVPHALPLVAGTTSGFDDHVTLSAWVAQWKEQNQNEHLSSPSGSRGYPVFRWLDREDMRRAGISFREYNEDTVLTTEAVEKYDVFILNNTSGTTMTVTIPEAADYDYPPRALYFKRFDTDVYRVAIKAGTLLIDGQSEWALGPYQTLCVAYDDANQATYHIISDYPGTQTYWQDIDFPIVIRTTGANIPTQATVRGNITAPQWAVNDYNVCEAQEMIHPWKEGSDVYWHVHVLTNGTDTSSRYLKWEIEFNYADINDQWQTNNIIQSAEMTIPPNTPALTHLIFNVYTWSPTALNIGGHVWARLRRIAATGTAPTNNPWCSMLQMHVECDALGSKTITAK